MSTYKRKGAATYSYDFVFRGHRFSGDTGQTQKRAADRVEESKRDEARREFRAGTPVNGTLTLEAAVKRYWDEVAQYQVNALTALTCLEWLVKALGRGTMLTEIDDNRVALVVSKRRGEKALRGRNKGGDLTPATVNRTATEPLRKVMTRARKVWKLRVADVDWSAHMLAEPEERVREASVEEEAAYMTQLERGYEDAVRFTQTNALRKMETVGLVWSRVDFFNREFTVIGKKGRSRSIPMTDATYALLWRQKDHHPISVFTYEAKRTDKRKGRVKGQRYPMTISGLNSAWRQVRKLAKLDNLRFHDLRHTGATRTLRATGNIRLIQELLGHRDLATTKRYAHVTKKDVLAALEATSHTEIPTANKVEGAKKLRDNEN